LKESNDKGEFDENYPEYPQEYINCVDDTIECMAKVIESMKVLRRCKEEYGSKSTVVYFGDTSTADREEAVKRFQEDPECQYFVGNAQTGGFGITLTAASNVVYYSNSYNLEHRLQSEDRAHRIGQKNAVTYVDLIASKTVDEKIVKALRAKKMLSAQVLGDEWKEWLG
jgi:SNF2 family DNA or RNA helicase